MSSVADVSDLAASISEADLAARETIATELGRTLFVEAGAGAGKTRELVGRVVNLVSGGVPVTAIAAITFTDKAAAELRDRIRSGLEAVAAAAEAATEGATDAASRVGADALARAVGNPEALIARRCRAALDVLDEAHIQTLHAFAQSIVAAHAVAADLPPVFEVADDIEAALDFDRRWGPFIDDLLSRPEHEQLMTVAWTLGLRGERLRDLAVQFHDHWDLLAVIDLPGAEVAVPDLAPLASLLDRILAARSGCIAPGDLLRTHIDSEVAAARFQLDHAVGIIGAARMFDSWPRLAVSNRGTKGNWRTPSKEDVVSLLREADAVAERARQQFCVPVLVELCRLIQAFTLEGVAQRRAAGRLEFHDLLVLARDLVRDNPKVRAALHAEVTHLLVDEFQDTDPLQVELAVLIASDASDVIDVAGDDSEPAPSDWQRAKVLPGRLFFVGDPKQSIYRFRRADIALYHRVRERFAAHRVELAHNFRSAAPVLEWINAVFEGLIGDDRPGQALWAPLALGHRRGVEVPLAPVVLLGGPSEASVSLAAIRDLEAADVAQTCVRAVSEPWIVGDPTDERGRTRSSRFDDVAILLPTRASLPALERALDASNVPYRVESRALLWATQEVRDLLSVLRAIDDPSDEVALVAALRSPLLACSDRDLVEWRAAGGRWSPLSTRPDVVDPSHPVAEAMAWLAERHEQRWQETVSTIAQRVVDERSAFEVAFGRRRQRESWHRVRFLLDQARAFADRGGAGLRSFVDWAERQADEGATAVETVVPESDDRAVRILTVHAAKGLEFPIVIVAGLNTIPRRWRPAEVLWSTTSPPLPLVSVGKRERPWHTPGYDDVREGEMVLEQQEALRLLYVACTRARDHLVVSLHHKAEPASGGACLAARLLPYAMDAERRSLSRRFPNDSGTTPGPLPPPSGSQQLALAMGADPISWQQQHDRLVALRGREHALAATAVAAAASDLSEREATVPGSHGRGGSAFGRAVHAVLQSVDLVTREGLDGIAAAQAAAEGLRGREAEVAASVRAALDAPVVAEARAGRFWREVYVSADIEGGVVDGFIDLLVEAPDGLVVVDYKTDAVDDANLAATVARYSIQVAAYALALEHNLRRPVARAELVFARHAGALQVGIEDLDAAKQAVRQVLAR